MESEGRNPASHLKNALEYIQNPDKTEECVLVGGINCLPDTAFEQMEETKNIFHKTGKRQGGYYVIPNFAIGAFISYHTNNEYVDRQTIPVNSTSVITSDQQHSIFQLPFGAAFRYNFAPEGQFQPYVGAQLGASYSEMSTYMNVLKVYDRNWGFYVAPEIGMTVYFTPQKQIGVHMAAYYNYATNKGDVLSYHIDGLNNWGIRLGLAF